MSYLMFRPGTACRLAVASVVALTALVPVMLPAQVITVRRADAPPKQFSAANEAKLTEFLTKSGEAKLKFWVDRLKEDFTALEKIVSVDAETKGKLEALATESAKLSREAWAAKLGGFWRKQYSRLPEESLSQILDQSVVNADQNARADHYGDYVRPEEQPAWTDGIKQILSAEQLAAWTKMKADRLEAIKKDVADFLKPSAAEFRESYHRMKLMRGNEIKLALALPKERGDAVDKVSDTVADHASERWMKQAERSIQFADDASRQRFLKSGRFYVSLDVDENERLDAEWKESVNKLLSAEELQKLEDLRKTRQERRENAVAQILITELDQEIAFTQEQREKLVPIAKRAASTLESSQQEMFMGFEDQLTRVMVLGAGAKVTEEELKGILEPRQIQQWQDCCKPPRGSNSGIAFGIGDRGRTPVKDDDAPPKAEPEELEGVLSDFLRDQALSERKRVQRLMIAKAEDAIRATKLEADASDRVRTAARGATEEALSTWRDNTESNVRPYLVDTTTEVLKQRLAAMPEYQFQRRTFGSSQENLLDHTLKAELTDEQRKVWDKEKEIRAAFKRGAIREFSLMQFDRRVSLSADQFAKIAAKFDWALEEYGQDMNSMFGSNTNPWYFQSYTLFLPFVAIPEAQMKEILTKEQWENWNGASEFPITMNYWENIQRNRENRLRQEKKK